VFGRRTSPPPDATTADLDETSPVAAGKGRATPKRKEAEAARKKRLTPPKSRKEAATLRRQRMKEQRVKQRQALAGGDARYLPARDKGKVKAYIRDYIDSRRTIGEFLIPIFIAVLLVGIIAQNTFPASQWAPSATWVIVIVLLILDSIRIVRGVKRGIRERFGADEAKGITFYALMRSWQMRRLRLPKTRVGHGEQI
jgi:hypothetical protein